MNKTKKEIAAFIVSPKSGEITDAIYCGDRILRQESLEYLTKKEKVIPHGEGQLFVKWFNSTRTALRNEKLTGNQWCIITLIMDYSRYDNGLVSDGKGNALTVEDISKLASVPVSSCFREIDSLVKKKILAKTKCGHDIKFFVNPFIFSKGTAVNKTLYELFKGSKWEKHYTEGKISEKD